MNKVWKWILIFVGALIVVFLISLAFLGGAGRMGYWGGMRGGYGIMGWGMGMLGFGFLRGLLGLVVLGLAVYGIVALFSRGRHTAPPPAPKTCPNCGRVVDKDWVNCPYCGQNLQGQKPPEEIKPEEKKPE